MITKMVESARFEVCSRFEDRMRERDAVSVRIWAASPRDVPTDEQLENVYVLGGDQHSRKRKSRSEDGVSVRVVDSGVLGVDDGEYDSDVELSRWRPKKSVEWVPGDFDAAASSSAIFGPKRQIEPDGFVVPSARYDAAEQKLLRGEGAAMAAYVNDGKRIPRRGEVGMDAEEIEQYERLGFVMSGSRHARMNAVRLRKENQVLTQEGNRQIVREKYEEGLKRENKVVGEFRELLQRRLDESKKSKS